MSNTPDPSTRLRRAELARGIESRAQNILSLLPDSNIITDEP